MQSSVTSTRPTNREIETTVLPNGIRVITESMPYVRSVSIGIWVASGSRHERPEEGGISHFIEHMLFKGTTSRTAEQIAREIDSTGGNLDAYTTKELVSYNTKVLDEVLPPAFDVLSDMVLHPLFRQQDVEKERSVILEELKTEVDNPEYMVHELFSRSFYHRHALGRSILGTKTTLGGFDEDQLRSYYGRVYVPANLTITAAGRLRHDCIADMVEQRFGSLSVVPGVEQSSTPLPKPQITLRNKRSLVQGHLLLGVPCYSLNDPRRFQAYVLNAVLGGGMSSRLFQNVREQHGLAYAVFSELNLYRDCGYLAVYAGTSVESAKQVLGLVMDEFRTLKSDPVPAEELRRAKDYLKGSVALGLESTSSRMANLARQAIYYDRFMDVDEIVESIERVTAEDVQQVAQDCFHQDKIAVTLLGRLDNVKVGPELLAC